MARTTHISSKFFYSPKDVPAIDVWLYIIQEVYCIYTLFTVFTSYADLEYTKQALISTTWYKSVYKKYTAYVLLTKVP